jgi:hypothetical protein
VRRRALLLERSAHVVDARFDDGEGGARLRGKSAWSGDARHDDEAGDCGSELFHDGRRYLHSWETARRRDQLRRVRSQT